jgi:hypothetical protein
MKQIVFILFCSISITLYSQTNFYFYSGGTNANNGFSVNTGGSWNTVNYPTRTDAENLTNAGCLSMSFTAAITGGIYLNSSGSNLSNYTPRWQNVSATYDYYGQRIYVDFTSSNSTTSFATITYSFTQSGVAKDLPISFDIFDINSGAYTLLSTSTTNFIDFVQVTGKTSTGVTVNPTFSNQCGTPTDEFGTNTIKGNNSCGASPTRDVTISFSQNISELTIKYMPGIGEPGNIAAATTTGDGFPIPTTYNPGRQYIDISPIRVGGTAAVAPSFVSGTTNICSGTTTTLTAVGGNASSRWYTGSCGGTLIGTGASITVAPTANTTYYVANPSACGITSCASNTVTVYGSTPSATGLAANDYLWAGGKKYDVIVDNNGSSSVSKTGSWTSSANAGFYGGTGSEWANQSTTGAVTANYRFTPNLLYSGNYDVYAWYVASSNRGVDVPHVINYNGGSITVPVNQTTNHAQWVKLTTGGPLNFQAGTGGYVTINNYPVTGTSKLVVADAIKFSYVDSTDYESAANWLQYNGTTFSSVTSPPLTSNNVHIKPNGGCITAQPTVDNLITTANNSGSANCNNITIYNSATLTYTNTTSPNNAHLHVAGNYNNQGTVVPGTGRVKFIKSGTQTITDASGTATFYEMDVEGNSRTTLNNNVTVTNAIRLSGVITTGTNRVYLNTTALDAATTGFVTYTGHIFGNIRRRVVSNANNYFFPVGVSNVLNTGRRLLVWMNNNTTGITDLDCSVSTITKSGNNVDAQLDITNKAKNYTQVLDFVRPEAEWTLTPNTAISGGSYGLQLYLQNFAALPDNKFTIMKRPDASTTFFDFNTFYLTTIIPAENNAGRIYSAGAGYAQKTGFTAFSKFVVATSPDVLPIELINYSIECENNVAQLEWVTSSETNNDFFTIWKSLDAINYNEIGYVKGSGNSSVNVNYTWIDDTKNNTNGYYKLSQTDFDGSSKHFPPMFLNACDNENSFTAFFNSNNQLIVDGENIREVTVYNALGQLIFSDVSFDKNQPLKFNQFINRGIYFVVARTDSGEVFSEKLILK